MKHPKSAGQLADPPPAAVHDSASVLATDAHAGKGGRYVFDPATGERRPVEDVAAADEPAPSLPSEDPDKE